VKFRIVVFRPFEGEILQGMVKYCTKDRVVITLGFFEDIILPADALPHPSQFDEKEKIWVWDYNSAEKRGQDEQENENENENGNVDADADGYHDEQEQDAGFYIWPKQKIRFRVTSIRYNSKKADVKPVIRGSDGIVLGKVKEQEGERERSQSIMSTSSYGGQGRANEASGSTASPNYDSNAPLSLLVSIKDNGLGPIEWWPSDEDEEAEVEVEAEADG